MFSGGRVWKTARKLLFLQFLRGAISICNETTSGIFGMSVKFLYFDLGRVLIDFSVERMVNQLAMAADVSTETVRKILFRDGLQLQSKYESGEIDSQGFYDGFCKAAGVRPDFDELLRAGTEIFWPNASMIPIVAQLSQTDYPMGILSNTCEAHWKYCFEKYRILSGCFETFALSYELKSAKPDAKIFQAAAELAGYAPEEIFFIDDVPGHIEGAKAAGFDAVLYTNAAAAAEDLRKRGIRWNY